MCVFPLVSFCRLSTGLYGKICNVLCVQCNVGTVCLIIQIKQILNMAHLKNKIKSNWAIQIHLKTANKRTILNFIFSIYPIKSKIPSNIENKKQNCQLKIWNKIKFNSACSRLSPELYQSSFMDNITCVWAGAKRTKGPKEGPSLTGV